jgi:hypothetical protein
VIDSLQEKFIPEETITDATGQTHWLQTVKRPIIGPDGLRELARHEFAGVARCVLHLTFVAKTKNSSFDLISHTADCRLPTQCQRMSAASMRLPVRGNEFITNSFLSIA